MQTDSPDSPGPRVSASSSSSARHPERRALRPPRHRSPAAPHPRRGLRRGAGQRPVPATAMCATASARATCCSSRPAWCIGSRSSPTISSSGFSSTAPRAAREPRMTAPETPPRGLQRTLHRDYYRTEAAFARERERIFFPEWFCFAREEEVAGAGAWLVAGGGGREHAAGAAARRAGSRRTTTSAATAAPGWCPTCGAGQLRGRDPLSLPLLDLPSRRPAPHRAVSRRGRRHRPGDARAAPGRASPAGAGSSSSGWRREEADATLARQLGAAPERLRRYPLAELRVAHRIEYQVAANWKVILENYNECYHCGPVHPELCRLVPGLQAAGRVGARLGAGHPAPRRRLDLHRLGHDHPGARSPASTTTSRSATRASWSTPT